MVLLLAGAALLMFDLSPGALLVGAPVGWAQDAGIALWLLFPLVRAVGYALCVIGARATLLAGLSAAQLETPAR